MLSINYFFCMLFDLTIGRMYCFPHSKTAKYCLFTPYTALWYFTEHPHVEKATSSIILLMFDVWMCPLLVTQFYHIQFNHNFSFYIKRALKGCLIQMLQELLGRSWNTLVSFPFYVHFLLDLDPGRGKLPSILINCIEVDLDSLFSKLNLWKRNYYVNLIDDLYPFNQVCLTCGLT